MNKTELIAKVSDASGVARREAEAIVDQAIYEITAAVRSGDQVRITGFGTFRRSERAARRGRNPRTGEAVPIPAKKSLRFSAGATLKRQLNTRGALPKPGAPKPSVAKAGPANKTAAAAKAPARKTAPAVKKTAPAVKKAAPAANKTAAAAKAPARKTAPAVKKAAPAANKTAAAAKAPARKASPAARNAAPAARKSAPAKKATTAKKR